MQRTIFKNMNEDIFWEIIEQSWAEVSPTLKAKRLQIAATKGEKEPTDLGMELADLVGSDLVENLEEKFRKMPQQDLLAFDRILEQKLYDIDREDVITYTDGYGEMSADGFLYARGFIVGMGRAYYELINNEPAWATFDLDAQGFCYTSWEVYCELYDDFTSSDISRESFRNPLGWVEED